MKQLLIKTLLLAFFASCTDKEPKSKIDNSMADCFIKVDYRYEDLLTKADIAKHITIDEASYKMEISSIKGEYGSCLYSWKSNRPDFKKDILGQIIAVPDKNHVEIKRLNFYTSSQLTLYNHDSALSLFDQSYKKLSQQEYDDLLANLQKEYANNPAGFEEAKGFLDARMNSSYLPVDNLGSRAYWKWNDEYGISLVVLTGTVHFTIEAKVAATKEPSLEVAVKFAKEVLSKCNK